MSAFEPTQIRTMHYQYIFMYDNIHYKGFLLFRLLEIENPYYQCDILRGFGFGRPLPASVAEFENSSSVVLR